MQASSMARARSKAEAQRNPKEELAPTMPGRPPSDLWPRHGRRPEVGFRVARPQKAAGARRLPPRSEPGGEGAWII